MYDLPKRDLSTAPNYNRPPQKGYKTFDREENLMFLCSACGSDDLQIEESVPIGNGKVSAVTLERCRYCGQLIDGYNWK